MVIRILFILLVCSPFHHLGAQEDPGTHPDIKLPEVKGPKPWTAKAINDKPGQFQFAIVTDRTGGHRPGVFEFGIEKLNLLQPEFVISVGDLIEGYTTDTVEIHRQWDEFEGFVDALDMPFFYVPGNHDITNPVMEKIWKQRIGPTHYSFVYKDVLFLTVNSEDQIRGAGRGSISQPQLDWIKKTLDAHQDVKWTFLFMHQPLWAQETDPVKWFEVEKLLEGRKHNVFVGHRHQYVRYERNKTQYYMLATTGGSTPLRGPQFGEFDHFVWVTMTEQGPILANLQLDGVFDHNVFNEELQDFTQKVWNSDIVRPEPLYVEGDQFKGDSLRIRLNNPYDTPVKIKLSNSFSWDLKADIPNPEITLQPNSVEFVRMDLEARKQKTIEQLKPVKVKADVAVQSEGKSDYYIPFEFNIAPLRKFDLVKSSSSIKVDGNLNDWKSLPYTLPNKEGGKFGVTVDNTFVYVGIQVNDSELLNGAKNTTFNQDFVGFLVDAQPTARSANERGDNWFENSLYFIASPEDESGKSSFYDLGENEKDLSWRCVKNKSGYAFEIAIPIAYIKKLQGENWQTIRVNVVVQDKDNNGFSERVMWFPNWRSSGNQPGSGMFFRK